MTRLLLSTLLILPLSACASNSGGTYPSLLPRATEAQGFEEPEVPAAMPVADDPALDTQITAVAATIAEKKSAFDAAAGLAARRTGVARGAPAGSEAWLNAQTALGDLDVLRADAGDPLATLEQMALDRAASGGQPYPRLDAALTEARAAIDGMSTRIAALQTGIAR